MKKRQKSHIVWNSHNPDDKIGGGNKIIFYFFGMIAYLVFAKCVAEYVHYEEMLNADNDYGSNII